ncbi:bile acid:sodium symporter family protein [Caulobacter soli]|uniref:bile acid:sodium symporter family protein n=1 Tax=Caulobacter soli TaxID=2708539 RepID=UPI0013EC2505|nr:bile acid:sodium symporter [Caulobacter soli]
MSMAELVLLVIKASIVVIVFALGLSARPSDLTFLVRHPALMAKSLLAMLVVMPILAVLLIKGMGLHGPVAILLVALSLAPVPPILPNKQNKAGGDSAYAIGLLATVGLVSILWIPLAIELIQRLSGVALDMPAAKVAPVVAMTVLGPLVAGIAVAALIPGPAAKIQPWVSKLGMLLLVVGALAILVSQGKAMAHLIGNGTLAAFVLFVLIGQAVGHLLGGPDRNDRTVLALATSSRHPAIAFGIAHLNFPHEKALVAAVLLFLIVNAIASIPYVAWRKKVGAADDLQITA